MKITNRLVKRKGIQFHIQSPQLDQPKKHKTNQEQDKQIKEKAAPISS